MGEYKMAITQVNDNLLQVILENIPFSVIITTPEGVITKFSREAEKMTGYKASEMLGKQTTRALYYAPQIEQLRVQFSQELGIFVDSGFDTISVRSRYNLPNEFECTYVRKDAKHVPVHVSISALRDDKGDLIGYVGITKDISLEKENKKKLLRSKELLHEAQQLAKIGSWSLDLIENKLEWSDEIFRILEINPNEFKASYEGFLNAIHPDDIKSVQQASADSVKNRMQYTITYRLLMKDGRTKHVIENRKMTYGEDATPLFSQGTVQDITESKNLEKKLKRYVALVDESVITSSVDLEGIIKYTSKAFCHTSQYEEFELLGKSDKIILHPEMKAEIYQELWDTITHNKTWKGEIQNRAKDGSAYWVYAIISPELNEDGQKIGYTAIHQDITDKKLAESLAVTDRLTGLYNRLKLDEVLESEIARAQRHDTPLSVIIVDVDYFKSVNDTHGHQVGDTVLKEMAATLLACGRKSDTVGRWGGEEFLVVLPNTDMQGAIKTAQKMRLTVEAYPFSVAGDKTASFGVSELSKEDNEDSLIERADKALYRAKMSGRNRVEY